MQEHDYHIAAEPDVSGKVNRHIWFYFILFGVALFGTVYGLEIMYRFELDREKEKKVGEVVTREALDQVALTESYLSGKRGLFEGKKNVSIDVAISTFLSDSRKAN